MRGTKGTQRNYELSCSSTDWMSGRGDGAADRLADRAKKASQETNEGGWNQEKLDTAVLTVTASSPTDPLK